MSSADSRAAKEKMLHPRYSGPVTDVHVHFDGSTLSQAVQACEIAGIETAINVWDLRWPPRLPAETEPSAWRFAEPRILRCHVPDLSVLQKRAAVGLASELQAAARAGCVGVKIWKNLGLPVEHDGKSVGVVDEKGRRVPVDDARLDELWDAAAVAQLPVLIHVGDPPEFWDSVTPSNPRFNDIKDKPGWWYGSRLDAPPLAQILSEFENLVARHPETTFIGAHFGCFISDHERWFCAYPNFHVDTAAAVSEMGKDDISNVRRLMMNWPDRFLFGTDLVRTQVMDYPVSNAGERWNLEEFFTRHWRFFETDEKEIQHPIPEQTSWSVSGLDLPEDVLGALYHGNALRLYALAQ